MSDRLYYGPSHTVDVVGAVISGNDTIEKLADELDLGERTVINKVHDPRVLGLIEKEDGSFEASDDARRLIQLQDRSVLEEPLRDLAGVETVLDRLEDEDLTTEDVGRIISFETESGASTEERFRDYGSIYVRWFDFLDLGDVTEPTKGSQGPLANDQGASDPRVPPSKVIEGLRLIDEADSREELANRLGYSEKEIEKILTTCYALGLARRTTSRGFTTTESGRTVGSTSQGKQRELLRKALLDVPLVEAYCERVPDEEFNHVEIMQQVSDDYNMGWSERTVQTKAQRLSTWLTYTGLAEKSRQGYFTPADKMPESVSAA